MMTTTPPAASSTLDFKAEVLKHCPNIRKEFAEPEPTPEELERMEAEREVRWRREEKRRREAQLDQFLEARGIRYKECSLSSFQIANEKQWEVVERLSGLAEDMAAEVKQGNGVILFGPSGTGKDHLLVGLARVAILQHGFSIAWKSGMELYAEFREAITRASPERYIIADLARVDILILSDPIPPAGDLTDYQMMTLFRIIDARYSACMPTWLSMNVANSKEADRRLGAPSVDRLRDNSLALFCDWPSHRKRKAVTT